MEDKEAELQKEMDLKRVKLKKEMEEKKAKLEGEMQISDKMKQLLHDKIQRLASKVQIKKVKDELKKQ